MQVYISATQQQLTFSFSSVSDCGGRFNDAAQVDKFCSSTAASPRLEGEPAANECALYDLRALLLITFLLQ